MNRELLIEALVLSLKEEYRLLFPKGRCDLAGFCAIASKLGEHYELGRLAHGRVWLAKHLTARGHVSTQHCWLVTPEETLLDLTAGQFNTRTPFELHLNYKPIHGEYVEIGTPHFEDWPEWQQPTKQTLDKLVKRVEIKISK